jgi:regulator of sigma E protease
MLQGPGRFILLLGVLITVHELGHFLVAKACGVKVIRFSIGFGPKLFGFTKGETEYQVALLPLGGYVKMAGDSPHEELSPEDAQRGFLNAAPWKRALIVVAGPVFNLVFPILVYFFVFVGPHETLSTKVGFVDPAMPAAAAGLRAGDRILAVEGEKVRTFDELRDAFVGRFDRPIPLTVERDGKQSIVEVTPRKIIETTTPVDSVERGQIGIQPGRKPAVVGVPPGSPAAQAGLKTFDRILAVNGVHTPDEAALHEQVAKTQGALELTVLRPRRVEAGPVTGRASSVVKVTVPRQPGDDGFAALGAEPSDLYVVAVSPNSAADKAGLQVGDRLVAFNGEPLRSFNVLAGELSKLKDQPFQLTWRAAADGQERTRTLAQAPLVTRDRHGETSSLVLGVRPWLPSSAEVLPVDMVTVNLGPLEALREAAIVVPKIVGQMVKVIGGLLTQEVSHKTLGGPVMMYQLASESAEQGLNAFLHLMAIISINLGVMNLLPIPILDGFHLLSAFWEGIRRRPIPVRVREVANVVGLILLVALMGMAFFNDITR